MHVLDCKLLYVVLMKSEKNKNAFLTLISAGLWEQEARLAPNGAADLKGVFQYAQEQSVVGLVTAGLEHVPDADLSRDQQFQFIGQVLRIEQRNNAMNVFVAQLMIDLHKAGVYGLLVKGQGIAQCYERPLWRTCGDIDLLFSDKNYEKAKALLKPMAERIDDEDKKKKHLALTLKGFDVELHGKMPFALSKQVDTVIDETLYDAISNGGARVWEVEKTDVYLPNADNDVIIIFTHFLHHFFIEGVGLRQICDWCRLLWTYRETLNRKLLEKRIRKAGLMSEWRVFAALAVDALGMPVSAMPFYDDSRSYSRKARRVLGWILESGNFGHNKDISYRAKHSPAIVNSITLWRRLLDFSKFTLVFPLDSPRFFMRYLLNRIEK